MNEHIGKAYIVAVDMGYGHQRAAYPLKDISATPADWNIKGPYIISANKNNGSLAFCFGPLAIIGANFIEKMESKWLKEIMVYALVGCSVFFYVLQL